MPHQDNGPPLHQHNDILLPCCMLHVAIARIRYHGMSCCVIVWRALHRPVAGW